MSPRLKSVAVVFSAAAVLLPSCVRRSDPRLEGSLRQELNGWIFVHLEGSPARVGFQHGYLLAEEIADAQKVIALVLEHDTKQPWSFFREAAQKVFWPKIDEEYRHELNGIAEGARARGVDLDVWDITALNGFLEFAPYYIRWWEENQGRKAAGGWPTRESCSAFVATGSYTRDGRPVIGHNAWTGYMEGARWRIIFDIVPERGHRILMDGFPGLIHSADDFVLNSAGILITETTISQFRGYNPAGIPEFVRARKAMQYSASIDDFARIMRDGNNGGYANNWLVADRKTGEIASLEIGLRNVTLQRTRDGYFVGANFPVNEKLAREETDFPLNDPSVSPNARRKRWEQLMAEYRGRIDLEAGKRFLSDHFDAYAGREDPNERTLCGHIELSPRGLQPWQPPFAPAGAVQAKVTDAAMAEKMSFVAAMGHSCGRDFLAAEHLKRHPQFEWQRPYLRDLKSHPWTEFSALRRAE